MRIEFIDGPDDGDDEQPFVADFEIYFEDDLPAPFAGTKLVGGQIRRTRSGRLYVNLPGRAFGAGSKRQYFDYLRNEDERHVEIDKVKEYILEEYRLSEPEEEEDDADDANTH